MLGQAQQSALQTSRRTLRHPCTAHVRADKRCVQAQQPTLANPKSPSLT